MKNITKKDIIYIWIISLSFLGLVFILSNTMYLYGSQLDWYAQHISIPEYFRTLFYSTKDLFPDFALNIGSGQNIYNFSYYGLLSPIILISYFLPNVSMKTYIMVSTILCVIISSILLYIFLKRKGYSSEVCFLSSFLFIMSTPLSFHSHRHIMFINYMPFLIFGLFGVDKKITTKKGWLLSLSVFLIIMTSYYYSIGGICCLIIYSIYCYLKRNKKVTFKEFLKFMFHIICPILIGILASAIITIPTLATIVNNRAQSNTSINWKKLLLPSINTENFLFNSYGLGLTAIIVPAIISFFKKKKENIFLGITLIVLVIFNLFNYILNGTMYIDSKSLIPFLPLYILVITEFLHNLFNHQINYKIVILGTIIISILIISTKYQIYRYLGELALIIICYFLYKKINKKLIFILPFCIFIFAFSLGQSKQDYYVLKYTTSDQESSINSAISSITESDDGFYRIDNHYNVSETVNKIYNNINYLNTTIYSSVSNQNYNSFYYDLMNNNMPCRNSALTVSTTNELFLLLSGSKYRITRDKALQGYELVSSDAGINIYKNDNVLPIGFATPEVMSYEDFEKLDNPEQQEALLKTIVADVKSSNSYVSNVKEITLDYDTIFANNDAITKEDDGTYTIKVEDQLKITYTLPEEYQNKILFISFKMNNIEKNQDLSITINSTKNKLTASSWKYYNENETFSYVLADQDQTTLTISFTEGTYNIGSFATSILDYAYLENISSSVDALNVNKEETKGDIIKGTIDVSADGYFMLSIPYDNGFTIKIDGVEQKVEKVDSAYIGCKITQGTHEIEIEYKAPLKNLALIISGLGILVFVVVTILERKRSL